MRDFIEYDGSFAIGGCGFGYDVGRTGRVVGVLLTVHLPHADGVFGLCSGDEGREATLGEGGDISVRVCPLLSKHSHRPFRPLKRKPNPTGPIRAS